MILINNFFDFIFSRIHKFRVNQTIRFLNDSRSKFLNSPIGGFKNSGTSFICISLLRNNNSLKFIGRLSVETLIALIDSKIYPCLTISHGLFKTLEVSFQDYDYNNFLDFEKFKHDSKSFALSRIMFEQHISNVFIDDLIEEFLNAENLEVKQFCDSYDFKKFLKPEFRNKIV
jgi:hypothetical protein